MKRMVLFILLILVISSGAEERRHRVLNLNRDWQFTTENDPRFSDASYDDSDWEHVDVSESWEDEGFPGYDGYAWYRTTFLLDKELEGKSLQLDLGRIDDVDRVWVNGRFLGGKGKFPPGYNSAYNVHRKYPLPNEILKFGEENVVAVQVYDGEGPGGLVSGRPGIYSVTTINFSIDLAGTWKFETGDDESWAGADFDDSSWEEVLVPGSWEDQGYPGYDGYGWYRKEVFIPKNLANEKLILALGKIDDIDQVFINGRQVGETGEFPGERYCDKDNNYYYRDRYYYINSKAIRFGEKNTIAVRVFDVWQVGGIYEGPIGITTRKDYIDYRREADDASSVVHEILDEFF
jgi:hypothetical protein